MSRIVETSKIKTISNTARNIILGIIFACVGLRLLFNSHVQSRETVLRDPFLLAHSLDPNYGSDGGFRTWRLRQWEEWLTNREILHRSATNALKIRRKYPLNGKWVNTVIIATPNEIANAFSGTLDPYGSEHYWSNRMFETYDIRRRNDGNYIIFHCPPTYIAVKIFVGKPVHLKGYSDIKTTSGTINYPRRTKCVQVT